MINNSVITVKTEGNSDIIDITLQVGQAIRESRLKNGTITVFVMGSTAGVTTIEYEPGLVSDFKSLWERIAPSNIRYQHDLRWGDGNGYSHLRASLLGAFLTVPFVDGKVQLGTWQQIIVVDFDNRPRTRTISLQVAGEL